MDISGDIKKVLLKTGLYTIVWGTPNFGRVKRHPVKALYFHWIILELMKMVQSCYSKFQLLTIVSFFDHDFYFWTNISNFVLTRGFVLATLT